VRLVTFNVMHGRAPDDGQVDLDRFAAAVRDLDADVLALQEVDRGQPRSHGADLTRVAAEATGAVSYRFAAALSGLPGRWRRADDEEPAGTPQYGVALLSRQAILSSRIVRLPTLPGRVPVWFAGRRHPVIVSDEPRVALVATLAAPGGAITIVCTHLSYLPGWNVVQLRRLVSAVGRAEPLVVMGDLNMSGARAARATRLRPLAVAGTYPADSPHRQLDHVLVRGPLSAGSDGVARRLPLSDHRALDVVLRDERRLA
jgi:endonuclease/exonuclease/phosphatase family metal-dependent hydrolase